MSKRRLFNRWVIFAIAVGCWIVLGLPLWWIAVGFGAPILPLPAPTDPYSILFLVFFYVPPLVMIAVAFGWVRARLSTRKSESANA
jgi:hypothetical protein